MTINRSRVSFNRFDQANQLLQKGACAGTRTGYPPATAATMFLLIVQKMRQALTFLATIENDHQSMRTLAIISILALLTISGAAYTDQILTSDRQSLQKAN